MIRKPSLVVIVCVILIGVVAACTGSTNNATPTGTSGPGDANGATAPAPTETVEPGTTVKSDDGKLSLFIPDGAIPPGTNVMITALPHDQLPQQLREVQGSGGGYQLEPDRLIFGKPATATLTIDRSELDDEKDSQSAYALVSFNQSAGREVLDSETHATPGDATVTVSAQIKHFSFITRTKGSLKVGFRPVAHEQAVGATFKPVVTVTDTNVQVTLAPLDVTMLISGVLEFGSDKDIAIHYDRRTNDMGTPYFYPEYRCPKTGIGGYGTHVTAVSTVEGLPNQHTNLAITIDGSVECKQGPVETPGISSPTPSGSTPLVHLIQTLGCEHTQPGVQSELQKKGRIVDASGAPVKGAQIKETATGPGLMEGGAPGSAVDGYGVTDANGEFAIEWDINKFGPYAVRVTKLELADGTPAGLDETSTTSLSYTVDRVCTPP